MEDKDSSTSPSALLQTMLDTISVRIEVLKPIRDGQRIVGFEYVIVNDRAKQDVGHVDLTGKKLMEISGISSDVFSRLAEVSKSGITQYASSMLRSNGSMKWFNETYVKSGDLVIVFREDMAERLLTNLSSQNGSQGSVDGNFQDGNERHSSVKRESQLSSADKILQRTATVRNLKEILDNSLSAVVCLDTKGGIIYWNAVSDLLFGFSGEEVIGKNWEEILFPDQLMEVGLKISIVMEQESPICNLEVRSRNKSGERSDILLNIFPLKDDSGKITACCLMASDDSERKKIELELEEDIHLISQVMETTPDIIYIMDINSHEIIYCNRPVAGDLGYIAQDIAKMNNPIFDIMHEEDIPAMMAHLKTMRSVVDDQTVVEIEYRLKNPNGKYSWYLDRDAVFRRNKAKVPIEKIGISQNITRRKEQEELRITSEEIIQQAEEIVAIGSWEYDIMEDNFKWSKGMYRLFNIDRSENVRPDIYLEYSSAEDIPKAQKVFDNIMYNFVDFEETLTIVPLAEEEKIVKIKAIVQRDNHGKPVKVIGVDLDITQQVKATEAINELYDSLVKKNQELHLLDHEIKTFNIVAAHDYKETLQQLYTNLEYIISNDARNLSNTGKGNIRRAQSAIQRMHLLTDDINNYFKLYDLDVKLESTNSLEILKEVLKKYQSKLDQYNAKVEYTDLPVLNSNPQLLSQLFTNLIDNAIKFRNLIAPLVIHLKYSQADEMNAVSGALKNTPYGIISISDNGLGFSEDEAEKIFEIFYRRAEGKERGTGIGLAICKRIMALHEGFITAEGIRARGATFNCYFPFR